MAQRKDTKTKTWYFYGFIPGTKKQYKKRGFMTRKDAREAEERFRRSLSPGSDPSLTLDQLVELYADSFADRAVKESTLVGDEVYYRNHIQSALGSKRVREITAPVINSWMLDMSKKRKPDGSLYAARTINHAKSVLSKYLSFAVRQGYVGHNPARDVPNLRSPASDALKEVPFWEPQEFRYFMQYVSDPYWIAVFEFMYGTGVREGELFGLTWADVNLARGTARITKSITNKTRAGRFQVTTPKNRHSIRTIDLQASLCGLLRERYEAEKKKDGFSSAFYVFGDVRPLSRSRLARTLDEYIQAAGVSRVTPHSFRHSHVSCLVNAGVDDSLIAERLGHSVAEMRATYTHIYREARRSMRTVLDDLYG